MARHYQQFIPVSVLGISATDYLELKLKAWTNRVVISFLNVCMQDASSRLVPEGQVPERFALAAAACQKLDEWQLCVEMCKRYLTQEEAEYMWNLSLQSPCSESFLFCAQCFHVNVVLLCASLYRRWLARFLALKSAWYFAIPLSFLEL